MATYYFYSGTARLTMVTANGTVQTFDGPDYSLAEIPPAAAPPALAAQAETFPDIAMTDETGWRF